MTREAEASLIQSRDAGPDDLEAVRAIFVVLKPFGEKDRERILRWSQEKLRGDSSTPMDDTMRQEWSRHYDVIVWRSIGFFAAAVGALLAYSFAAVKSLGPTQFVAPASRQWWVGALPELGGMFLTVTAAFFVASFRSFRHTLHVGIANDQLRDFLIKSGATGLPHQWMVLVGVYLVVTILFTYNLAAKTSSEFVFLPSILASAVLVRLWAKARPKQDTSKRETRKI